MSSPGSASWPLPPPPPSASSTWRPGQALLPGQASASWRWPQRLQPFQPVLANHLVFANHCLFWNQCVFENQCVLVKQPGLAKQPVLSKEPGLSKQPVLATNRVLPTNRALATNRVLANHCGAGLQRSWPNRRRHCHCPPSGGSRGVRAALGQLPCANVASSLRRARWPAVAAEICQDQHSLPRSLGSDAPRTHLHALLHAVVVVPPSGLWLHRPRCPAPHRRRTHPRRGNGRPGRNR